MHKPSNTHLPHVVILGGGFGGLYAAKALKDAPVQISLFDAKNYHLFQPLLYQVATAALNPSDIASPIRCILRGQKNCSVFLAKASAIDLPGHQVFFGNDHPPVAYDYLLIATGVTHHYFQHPEWADFAPGLKTIEDALEIRKRILFAYEAAECEDDPVRREAWMTFVIVGGGPTGVELAGALAEIAHLVLTDDFRRIDSRKARIILVESGPRILPGFSPPLSLAAQEKLHKLRVELHLGKPVTQLDGDGVIIGNEPIKAHTILWAAGVTGNPLAATLGIPLDRLGRICVNEDLTLKTSTTPLAQPVFVVGDLAALTPQNGGAPLPGIAPVAIQQGRHAALNIKRLLKGQKTLNFKYKYRGILATIGRAAAVAEIGKVRTCGLFAWLLWLIVHIFWLIGFRNRLIVIAEWAWTYLRYERGARLITGNLQHFKREKVRPTPTTARAVTEEE